MPRVGDTVVVPGFFQDSTGTGVDPGSVTFYYIDPSGNIASALASAGEATGWVKYSLTVDEIGCWRGHFHSAAAAAREKDIPWGFDVEPALSADSATIATAVWNATTRTLSSFGSLVADVAAAVWGAGTRTLTSAGTLAADIWNALTSTFTTSGSVGKLQVDKLSALGTASVTISAPVLVSGSLSLVRGDDYLEANGRSLVFNRPSSGWPSEGDLTTATIVMTIRNKKTDALVTAVAVSHETDLVRAELTHSETALLPLSTGNVQPAIKYDVQAVLSGGAVATLARGEGVVYEDQSR